MKPRSKTRARFELKLQSNTDSEYFIQLKMKIVSVRWDNIFNSLFKYFILHLTKLNINRKSAKSTLAASCVWCFHSCDRRGVLVASKALEERRLYKKQASFKGEQFCSYEESTILKYNCHCISNNLIG